MKTLTKTLIFAALAVMMASCHFPDDYFDDNPGGGGGGYDINKDIVGEWFWVQSSGGIAGTTYYQDSYPHKMAMNFDGVRFSIFKDGQIIQSGSYKIDYLFSQYFNEKCYVMTTYTEYMDPEFVFYFTFTDKTPIKVKIERNKLYLVNTCCDMFDSIFERYTNVIDF